MTLEKLHCWPWKVAVVGCIAAFSLLYLYYRIGCTLRGNATLDTGIEIRVAAHTEGLGGAFISRSFDVYRDRKFLGRMWCAPMPRSYGTLSSFHVAHCVGQSSEYLVVNDADAFWIMDLNRPSQIFTAFPETVPPKVMTAVGSGEGFNMSSESVTYEDWIQRLQRRTLLNELRPSANR
jgi:hypothetical protein